jgi:assimilatory nitrate reductase catalytic subunit
LGRTEAGAVELLAGRPTTPLPNRGAIVCVCHGIGEVDIAAAASAGAATVEAIGAKTCAGTNCGSCRPAIARLLETVCTQAKEAAE